MQNPHNVSEPVDWWNEAERWRRLSQADPGSAALRSNQANALWLNDEPLAALPEAERAVQLDPRQPLAWRCLGNVLQDVGALDRAVEAYQRSLALQADAATAFNASKALMGLGRFGEAYGLAEQRLALPGFAVCRSGPYWQGWPDAKRLWLWSEQGHGDLLQYLRWLVPLLRQGRRVVLELEEPMVGLARQGLAWIGGDLEVQARLEPVPVLPDGACQGPLLSLPLLLGEAPLQMLCPYLRLPQPEMQLGQALRRRPRVGLVWASGAFLDGHVLERDYRRKSLTGPPLRSLLNGLAERPLDLVALQFGADRQPPAWSGAFADVLPEQADFLETARELERLDLLISVDTAAAHLAGAMGLPVWLLLPWAAEGRWGRDRADSPWYPSARLYRQGNDRSWTPVLARIGSDLLGYARVPLVP